MATVKQTKALARRLNTIAFTAREVGYGNIADELVGIRDRLMGWVDRIKPLPSAPPVVEVPPKWAALPRPTPQPPVIPKPPSMLQPSVPLPRRK